MAEIDKNGRKEYYKSRPTRGQMIKMVDWLRGMKKELELARPTVENVTQRMSEELGFPITKVVLYGLFKDVDGLRWYSQNEGASRGGEAKSKTSQDLRKLRQDMDRVLSELGTLRLAFGQLCLSIKEPLPECLVKLEKAERVAETMKRMAESQFPKAGTEVTAQKHP